MLNKKAREMGIGSAEVFDLPTARAKVVELRKLLDEGIDPIEQRNQVRRQQAAEASSRRTFDECVTDYLALNESAWKNAKHAAQWKSTLETYATPVFGDWPVADISDQHVRKVVEPIWTTKHETATRVLNRIHRVLMWAATQNRRPPLPDDLLTRVKSGLTFKRKDVQHHPACPHAKAGPLLIEVRDSMAADVVKLAFIFTVLSAARSGEVRGATWTEISFDDAVWTIPKERMKAGVEHSVPLSDTAIAVLRGAEKFKDKSGLVFPSGRQKSLSDMVFTELLRRLKQPYTMHGFRSTFRDWSAECTNYPNDVCEAALAHKLKDKVEAAYKRSDLFDKRRQLMADWAAYLEKTANSRGADRPKDLASTDATA